MNTLTLTNNPWRRMQVRNLTRDIDALEQQMIRAAIRGGQRRAVAAMRAQLSALTIQRDALFSEA